MTNKYYNFEFNEESDIPEPINADDFDSIDSFVDALNARAYGETESFDMMEKKRLEELRQQDTDEEHESVKEYLKEFRLDDPVNNPEHYTIGSIETIDYITDVLGEYHAAVFCHGNVLKYTGTRLFGKGKPIQDAKKAVWYLNKMIELLEFTEDTNW